MKKSILVLVFFFLLTFSTAIGNINHYSGWACDTDTLSCTCLSAEGCTKNFASFSLNEVVSGLPACEISSELPGCTTVPGSTAAEGVSSETSLEEEMSTPIPVALPSLQQKPAENCQSGMRCRQIDFIWAEIISPYVTPMFFRQFWNSALMQWEQFVKEEVIKPEVPTAVSPRRTKVVEIALREWKSWQEGNLLENSPDGSKIVTEKYFPACGGSTTWTANVAWSAAFISYVLKEAGFSDFPANCAHINYFRDVKSGKSRYCTTHPLSEVTKLKAGDVLCNGRGETVVSYGSLPANSVPTHCNIVVEKTESVITVIGGNLGNSVKKDTVQVSTITSPHYFGFISCGGSALADDPGVSEDLSQKKYDLAFLEKVEEISAADGLNIKPIYLIALMSYETGDTFSPSQKNAAGSGAVGLIQFMPDTAVGLETTTDGLAGMSKIDQLDFVKKYYLMTKKQRNSFNGQKLGDVAMAVFWPEAVGKEDNHELFGRESKHYRPNSGLDDNNDGKITKIEYVSRLKNRGYIVE